jgi:hypothetical protein
MGDAQRADARLASAGESDDLSVLLLDILESRNDFQDDYYTWTSPSEQARRIRETLDHEADRIRELFPPPSPPVLFDPRWRTADVVQLAQALQGMPPAAFEKGEGLLGIQALADALEDAGCRHPGILRHCRATADHDPECWVLAMVLGLDDVTP